MVSGTVEMTKYLPWEQLLALKVSNAIRFASESAALQLFKSK